jgi:tetratricopeptide (TPR) repeat protein
VALLHSFWYEEAARSFAQVVHGDPRCAFGYWGSAMSRLHPLWAPPTPADYAAGRVAARKAVEASRAGSRPRRWAEAIDRYFERYESVDHPARLRAYESAMRDVAKAEPGDEEAQIFYALALIADGQQDATDTTHARQRQAARILEPLYRRHPDHPGLAHYLIHAYDSPALAGEGVRAAERYADIAPSVPHALHMPSHIYVRVGRWEDVIASNLRSAEAGRRFERAQGKHALWDQRAHALDYLVYGQLQLGRGREAEVVAAELGEVKETFPGGAITTDYALAAIPARVALERNRWADAVSLPLRAAPAWPGTEAITHFARAIGAARSGRPPRARAEVDTLAQLERTLAALGGAQTYWSGQVAIQRLAAGAWVALADRDTAAALRLAAEAADREDRSEKPPVTPGPVLPARELYADLLLSIGRRDEAGREYQAVLTRQPGRSRSLAGLAATRAAGASTAQ